MSKNIKAILLFFGSLFAFLLVTYFVVIKTEADKKVANGVERIANVAERIR